MPEPADPELLEELHRWDMVALAPAEEKKNQSQKLKKPRVVTAALIRVPKMNLKPCSMNYTDLVVEKEAPKPAANLLLHQVVQRKLLNLMLF